MYKITDNERAKLVEQMTKLLDEYDYEYTMGAIDKIIDTWCENKQTLIEAFKNHPNYVEGKFLIAFESDYEREIDKQAIYDFSNWIRYNCLDHSKLNDDMYYFLYYGGITDIKTRTIDEYYTNEINKRFPDIKAHNGEKTSRVINRICAYLGYDKHTSYNREFAKYADALSPIKIKRHTILSINPIDYLTMSFGNSWSSCHTIDKHNRRDMPDTYEGQYSSGTISYMLDGTSMVFYTVDAKYDGNDFFTQNKINRQMYHWSEDKLLQSRLYPQHNDGSKDMYKQYRAIVQNIMSIIFDFPNLWIKKDYDCEEYTRSYGTHYRDYENFDDCNISIPKGTDNTKYISIGHDPICIECGCLHEEGENINHCHARGSYCEHCGCWIDEDDVCWMGGSPYCSDCVTWCDCCQEYERADRVHYIDSYDGNVCDWCLDNHFTCCEDCGEYIHTDDIQEIEVDGFPIYVCEDCLEDNYEQCVKCDEWHKVEDMEEIDGEYYCQDCYEEMQEENEENETEEE